MSGLTITVVYYGLVQLGHGLAQAGTVSPAFGVWLPNILVGLHRRFSAPVACLVLGLLAAPIVLLSRTFSRAAGGVSGLIIMVVYYGLVQLGRLRSRRRACR